MKKGILVTGCAGLLGSRFCDWLLENKPEYEVIGIDNLFVGFLENINPKVIFYKHDLSKEDISYIFDKHNIEYVFHFAAYAAEGLSPFMRIFNDSNNMLSTDNIINECVKHNVKRLIYTSSMSVYGHSTSNSKDGRFWENDTPQPIDPYGVSKYACELNIQSAGKQFGLDWCILRPHNVFGKKQNIWDKYRNVLGIWMYSALNNQSMKIFGDGEQKRAFSYIDDCLQPFWNAAVFPKASREIINLGGINETSIKDACFLVSDVTGYKNIEYCEPRYEVKIAVPSYEKSIWLLDYKETTTLENGIKEMWEWAKQQPKREQKKWDSYEINKQMYSYWK